MELPEDGLRADDLRVVTDEFAADDVDWRHGRGWSLVYDSPAWHAALVRDAATRFADENALSHAAFPSAARFESAVVSMVASVVSPGVPSHGVFTSGGTESTIVALKAYRDRAGHRDGSVVVPATAHPAFGKAADYLGLRLVTVPVGLDGLPDPDDVVAAIDAHTVAVGLSAPCYPFGVVDPIEAIASRAADRGVGVHVDAALGGLFLPFLHATGAEPVHFGVDVHGVTSVAVDVHKYGYGAKGASVVLFATNELRHAAYHTSSEWPGGAYASSGVLGTRSVGSAAAAFTALAALGRSGYRNLVAQVIDTTHALQGRLLDAGPFHLVGAPCMSVFAITSPDLSVHAVAAALERRGWRIDVQSPPPAMHFIVFPRHAGVVDEFATDFAAATEDAKAGVDADAAVASYGVMVRGEAVPTVDDLFAHLDARFDGTNPR